MTPRLHLLWLLCAAALPPFAGCRCPAKLDRDRPLAHCDKAGPGRGQFSFVATTDPPRLTFEPTCDGQLPLQAGRFRFDPATRVLSGRVRLWNRGHPGREPLVAYVDFLADHDGDKRFGAQVATTRSVVSAHGRRGFLHGRVSKGKGRWAHWAFVVPRGSNGPLHGAGWISAAQAPVTWVELEELAAGSAEGRRGPGGWQWLHRQDGHSGWGVLHVSRVKGRRRLSRPLRVPRPGPYRVLLRGLRHRPAGVVLRIGGHALQATDAKAADHGFYELGEVTLGRRTSLSLEHVRKRGVTLDALVLVPLPDDASAPPLPRHLPPTVLASRRAARSLLPRYLRQRLAHLARPAPVTDAAEWTTRAQTLRHRLRRVLDLPPRPAKPSAPRVRVVGRERHGALLVEKLFIEGVPGLWASALLYRPAQASGRLPAVLHALGHYGRGKHYRPARIFDANLASRGFVVLAVDALGLGERVVGPEDHHFQGLLHWLAGRSPTREMVGEMLRFVDYLQSRPDVDPQRIGMAGSSGGGTLTLYATAVDRRIRAAAPLAAVADWRWLFRFIGGDPEMYPRNVARVADYATLLRLAAPRPVLVGVGKKDDMFPPRVARRVVGRARDAFRLLGRPGGLQLFVDPDPHGLKPGRRAATYRFFQRHLRATTPVSAEDTPLMPLPARTGKAPATRSLVDGARSAAKDLPPALDPGGSSAEARAALRRRRLQLEGVLARPATQAATGRTWTLRGAWAGNALTERVVFRSETGMRLPVLWIKARGPRRAQLLYVSDAGRQSSVHAVTLAEAGFDVYVVDLPGLGETTPGRRYRYGLGRPGPLYLQDFFGAACLNVLGDSLYALRVDQLRRLARHLRQREPKLPLGVVGQGTECGVYALTLSALEPEVAGAAALTPLHSFKQEILRARFPAPGLVAFGVLQAVDLPELVALSAPRPVLLLGGRASHGRPVRVDPRADYALPQAFYARFGAASALTLGNNLTPVRAPLLRWAAQLTGGAR